MPSTLHCTQILVWSFFLSGNSAFFTSTWPIRLCKESFLTTTKNGFMKFY